MKKEKQKIFLYSEKKPGKVININNLKYGKLITVNDFVKSVKLTQTFKNDNINKISIYVDGKFFGAIGLPFCDGNKKIDKKCLIHSIMPIITCPNCSKCKKDCYAIKALRQYPDYFNKTLFYTFLIQHDIKIYKDIIEYSLYHTTKKIVRLHESGDFMDDNYILMWYDIAKKFKDITFYSYTKSNNPLIDILNSLDNVNINYSTFENNINFGNKKYLNKLTEKIKYNNDYSFHYCPCGSQKIIDFENNNPGIKYCMSVCKKCAFKTGKKNIPLFIQH